MAQHPHPQQSWDEDFTSHLGRDLVTLSHRWRRALSRRIAALGVSDAQWSILDSLRRTGDGVHQQVIATRLGLDRSAVVRVMNDMEKLGLISRKSPARDARQKVIYLTPHGDALAARIFEVIRSVEQPLIERIPPEDLLRFYAVLRAFTTDIDALEEPVLHPAEQDE